MAFHQGVPLFLWPCVLELLALLLRGLKQLYKQRGVSGSQLEGCDAIVVAGQRNDEQGSECDQFSQFMKAAETKYGTRLNLTSANKVNNICVCSWTTLLGLYWSSGCCWCCSSIAVGFGTNGAVGVGVLGAVAVGAVDSNIL